MEFTLDKGEARAVVVLKGQNISISCIGAGQLADLVFLGYHQGITLDRLRRFVLKCGDELFDSNEEGVLRVTSINSDADTNILYPGCRRKLYAEKFGKDKNGCRDLLASALGVPFPNLPSTINLFMDFELDCKDFSFKTRTSRVKEGDSVSFYVLKNCTVAISACPSEAGACKTEGKIEVKIQ
ncbi:DUF1989 domain-containing protein [Methanosarcina sp. KYL-1]|uniref:DUF1989 domain-containing protein n=1 Tax=Methanosarcina sp. KYL-1 TaxID=2602068 RepID=UPI002100DBEC|nr:DUF1989 domain-containing protein [Methanosarcina sp. KYL-1]